MSTSLRGRSVLVTGGTKGIGLGIARVFAGLGASVCIVGRNDEEGRAAQAALAKDGGRVRFCRGDVRRRADMDRVAADAAAAFGGIDVLCANAGILPQARIADMSEADWDDIFATNAKGMLFALQACLPWLQRSGAGRVVLTSSITGPLTGYPGWSHYGASKAAMLGFMRTAALELAGSRITINAVLPGNVLTEGLAAMGKEYLDGMAAAVPLRRLGTVEEIGWAAAFFASAEAGYVTGQTLIVDGGQTLPESPQALE